MHNSSLTLECNQIQIHLGPNYLHKVLSIPLGDQDKPCWEGQPALTCMHVQLGHLQYLQFTSTWSPNSIYGNCPSHQSYKCLHGVHYIVVNCKLMNLFPTHTPSASVVDRQWKQLSIYCPHAHLHNRWESLPKKIVKPTSFALFTQWFCDADTHDKLSCGSFLLLVCLERKKQDVFNDHLLHPQDK